MFILWESNKREGNPRRQTPTSLPLIAFDIVLFLSAFPPQAGRGGGECRRKQCLKGGKPQISHDSLCLEGSVHYLGCLSQDLGVTVPLRMGIAVTTPQAVDLEVSRSICIPESAKVSKHRATVVQGVGGGCCSPAPSPSCGTCCLTRFLRTKEKCRELLTDSASSGFDRPVSAQRRKGSAQSCLNTVKPSGAWKSLNKGPRAPFTPSPNQQ